LSRVSVYMPSLYLATPVHLFHLNVEDHITNVIVYAIRLLPSQRRFGVDISVPHLFVSQQGTQARIVFSAGVHIIQVPKNPDTISPFAISVSIRAVGCSGAPCSCPRPRPRPRPYPRHRAVFRGHCHPLRTAHRRSGLAPVSEWLHVHPASRPRSPRAA
jgi:hypothetical protein